MLGQMMAVHKGVYAGPEVGAAKQQGTLGRSPCKNVQGSAGASQRGCPENRCALVARWPQPPIQPASAPAHLQGRVRHVAAAQVHVPAALLDLSQVWLLPRSWHCAAGGLIQADQAGKGLHHTTDQAAVVKQRALESDKQASMHSLHLTHVQPTSGAHCMPAAR